MLPLLCVLALQVADPKFERLSVLDGLSQSQVLAIAQDKYGFVWFGTQDGLNRYDGYHFQVFRTDSDVHPLSDNHVQALLVDRKNRLWIGTKEGGLMVWDLDNDDLRTFRHDVGDPGSLSSDNVWSLFEDREGHVWIGTLGGGLNRWLPESRTFRRYAVVDGDATSLSSNSVRSFYQDEEGVLWVGTDKGLNRMTGQNGGFRRYTNDPEDPHSLASGYAFAMTAREGGGFWVGLLGGGVCAYDPATDQFQRFGHDPDDPGSLSTNRVWSLFRGRDGRLWVGTMDRGLNLWDPDTQSFEVFRHSRHDLSLSSDKIWSIFEDRSGILWLGTGDHGVNKLNYHAKPFLHLPKPSQESVAGENLVTTALAPADRAVWVASWGQGLFRMDPESRSLTKIELPPTKDGSPRMFVSLHAENDRSLWMGIWSRGLVHLDLETLEETSYLWNEGGSGRGNHVTQIRPFGDRFMLATYGHGIRVFDRETAAFSKLETPHGPIEVLSTGNVFCIYQRRENEWWFGTVGKGLYRFDSESGELRNYRKKRTGDGSLPSDRVTVLMEDDSGRFWIGTDGGGLAQYVPETDGFEVITTKTGLPSNVINGVIQGPEGNLWLATNKGLDCFDPESQSHRIFGPADGLQLEYNAGAFAATGQGIFLFGGPKGIDYFNPTQIKQNPFIPQIALSQFKVFNQPRDLGLPLNRAEEIELSYTDNFFAFEFAALDYASPGKNQFKVKLEGVDKDWVYNGTRNYKEYTNLGGGLYTFKIQGSNGDGVWNETGREIDVRIIPPFWKTRTFFVVMGIFLLLAIVAIVHFFERKKILRLENKQRAQWESNKRMAEAREVERLQIAQEIHDGPIQDLHAIQFQMSLAKKSEDYSNIGKYLLSVISSLRRLCGHLRPPALMPFGLAAAIRSLVDSMRDKYPEINIALSLENDGQKIPEDVRLALFRICQEALNNALQHSRAQTIKIVFKVDRAGLHLSVSDDGQGFELSEDLLDFSSHGHYGLLGISERVQAIGGKVKIDTKPGGGTRVSVQLQKEKAALLEEVGVLA